MTLTVDTAQAPERETGIQVLDLIVAGVAAGLPVPMGIDLSYDWLVLRLPGGDTAGVDAWAAYLALGEPKTDEHVYPGDGERAPWRSYDAPDAELAVAGWRGRAWCSVRLSAEDIAALGEPVGEVGT